MAKDVKFDPEHPLEPVQGESKIANQALRDYAFMGTKNRSIRKLFERYKEEYQSYVDQTPRGLRAKSPPPTRFSRTLFDWSSKYMWPKRADAWDRLGIIEEENKWAERRRRAREDEWEKSSALLELADKIIAEGPKFVRTRRRIDKSTGAEIITVALDGYLAVKALESATKIRRMAAGMETNLEKHEHSGPGGGPIHVQQEDISGLDDDQLRNALANLGALTLAVAGGTDVPPEPNAAEGDDPASEGEEEPDA